MENKYRQQKFWAVIRSLCRLLAKKFHNTNPTSSLSASSASKWSFCRVLLHASVAHSDDRDTTSIDYIGPGVSHTLYLYEPALEKMRIPDFGNRSTLHGLPVASPTKS